MTLMRVDFLVPSLLRSLDSRLPTLAGGTLQAQPVVTSRVMVNDSLVRLSVGPVDVPHCRDHRVLRRDERMSKRRDLGDDPFDVPVDLSLDERSDRTDLREQEG